MVAKPYIKVVATTTAIIETVSLDDKITAAAAILPDSDREYNSDSDEDWYVLHHEVSPPIHGKYLIWCCQLHSLTEDFPVMMHTSINNSMHLILIFPKLIEQLGLKKYKLHKPELVNVAFSNQRNNYVKLSLTSLDFVWMLCSL